RNTGTPIREKPSARVIRVTVMPVPVAPATRPWRLPYFGSRWTGPPSGVVTALPTRRGSMRSIRVGRRRLQAQAAGPPRCRPGFLVPPRCSGYPAGRFGPTRWLMSILVRSICWLLPAVLLSAALSLPAHAQPRRAQAAIDALNERMLAAETRYRE